MIDNLLSDRINNLNSEGTYYKKIVKNVNNSSAVSNYWNIPKYSNQKIIKICFSNFEGKQKAER